MGRRAVRITADTNIFVRAITADDARQAAIAQRELATADLVAVTPSALCELAWVLSRSYKLPSSEIAKAIRVLLDAENVAADRASAEAGLVALEAGGDFADGVIAHQGAWLGADTFVSFDRRAVKLMRTQGGAARLLA